MKTKFLLLISTAILLTSIALALHTITPTSYSTNETIQTTFNISVDNTNIGQDSNITNINITLPSTFTFTLGTNGSNATVYNFTNTSNVLTWTNTTPTNYVVNGSEIVFFWFNATASTPGTYNITVSTTNITDTYHTNISVEVNDTSGPTASFGTNPINTYNSSSANVTFDIKCNDAYSVNNILLYGNWSAGWHANNTNTSAINNTFSNISVTNIADGSYKWAAYCNDSTGNGDWTTTNRTFTVDTTNPTASASCSRAEVSAGESVTCTCTGTDATSGVSTSTATSTINTGSLSGTQTYTCTVTDYAGNTASTTATYSVTQSSSGGTGSSTTPTWTNTHTLTNEQFQNSFTKEMSTRQRLRIQINSENHHVGIIETTATTATIEIASTPQTAILSIGDERKFEVTNDTYYDILVRLNSITNGKASITIQPSNELITEETIATEGEKEGESAEIKAEESAEETSQIYKWTIGLIVALVIIALLSKTLLKKKKK